MTFITADQILCHLVGDYVLQSHWMAVNKTKKSSVALIHAVTYALPFLFLTYSQDALIFITVTHFLIDRFRLARYVVWFKNCNWRAPITSTGYQDGVPPWLSTWLLIIVDNTLHLICNGIALSLL